MDRVDKTADVADNPVLEVKGVIQKEKDKENDAFYRILRRIAADQETGAQRAKRKAEEMKADLERRDRMRKINELRSLIAYLRSRLVSGGYDKRLAAMLSMAQSELFWLMSAM